MERQLDPAASAVLVRDPAPARASRPDLDAAATAVEADADGVTLRLADGRRLERRPARGGLRRAPGDRPGPRRRAGRRPGRRRRRPAAHRRSAHLRDRRLRPARRRGQRPGRAGLGAGPGRRPQVLDRRRPAGPLPTAADRSPGSRRPASTSPRWATRHRRSRPVRGAQLRRPDPGHLRPAASSGTTGSPAPSCSATTRPSARSSSSSTAAVRCRPTGGRCCSAGRSARRPPSPAESPALMPDAATVCQCNTVTKGDAGALLAGRRAASVGDVVARTRATTGCGTLPRRGRGHRRLALHGGPPGRSGGVKRTWWWSATGWSGSGWSRRCGPATRRAAGDVTVLAEETRPAYDRVRLSPASTGRAPTTSTCTCPTTASTCGWASRRRAIDRGRRVVVTDAGELPVRRAGARHRVVPVRAADRRHATCPACFVYRTIDDLEAIRRLRRGPPHRGRSSAAGCSAWRRPTRCACSA